MVKKSVLFLGFFLIIFLGNVFAIQVSDTAFNDSSDAANNSTQSFAQVNAKITDLTNKVQALQTQLTEHNSNAFTKSDLQNLYDNMVNINHQAEMAIIMDVIVVVILAFAVMFILIGKNALPQHKKKPKEKKVNLIG